MHQNSQQSELPPIVSPGDCLIVLQALLSPFEAAPIDGLTRSERTAIVEQLINWPSREKKKKTSECYSIKKWDAFFSFWVNKNGMLLPVSLVLIIPQKKKKEYEKWSYYITT